MLKVLMLRHSAGFEHSYLPNAEVAIKEIGQQFAGKIGFLTTADIQYTLPLGNPKKIRDEVRELVKNWSTPKGGFIVFNYGDPVALGVDPAMTEVMFQAFKEMM